MQKKRNENNEILFSSESFLHMYFFCSTFVPEFGSCVHYTAPLKFSETILHKINYGRR